MKTIVLDIESTGLPPKNADYKIHFMDYPYITSLAYKVNDLPCKEFIVNLEGILIPKEVTAIHGITDEMSSKSPYNILDVLGQLIFDATTSDYIVGFNIYFDSSTIKANILRLIQQGRTTPEIYDNVEEILHKDKRIDVMRLCQKLFGGKWPTLDEAYYKIFGVERVNSHASGIDVEDTYKIYCELVKRGVIVPKWDNTSVVEEE